MMNAREFFCFPNFRFYDKMSLIWVDYGQKIGGIAVDCIGIDCIGIGCIAAGGIIR